MYCVYLKSTNGYIVRRKQNRDTMVCLPPYKEAIAKMRKISCLVEIFQKMTFRGALCISEEKY